MPLFVILNHDHPFPHWDLMLETGDRLRTWRLLDEPAPEISVPAERLPDHRMLYLDYEGSLSGDRGRVSQWDSGTFKVVVDDREQLQITLHGERLRLIAGVRHSAADGQLRWEFGSNSVAGSQIGPA